jgi:hypothetical protein
VYCGLCLNSRVYDSLRGYISTVAHVLYVLYVMCSRVNIIVLQLNTSGWFLCSKTTSLEIPPFIILRYTSLAEETILCYKMTSWMWGVYLCYNTDCPETTQFDKTTCLENHPLITYWFQTTQYHWLLQNIRMFIFFKFG